MLDKINIYNHEEDFFQDLEIFNLNKQFGIISFFNHHCFNLCYQNENYQKGILNSDFLLRDGIGVKLALKKMKHNPGINLNGTDLIPKIFNYYDNKNCNFLIIGSKMHLVSIASQKLIKNNKYNYLDGFQSDDVCLNFIEKNINNKLTNIILLAMGMPRQENLGIKIKKQFVNHSGLIINGGGVVDFISKRKRRAPLFIRRIGMEWLFRLIIEPKRLFNRYVIGIPIFFFRILK